MPIEGQKATPNHTEAGQFTLGPMLMALIGGRKREKKRA